MRPTKEHNLKRITHNVIGWIKGLLFLLVITVSAHGQDSDCAHDYLCPKEPKRLALVIGNANYTNLESIPSAATDADQISHRLGDLAFEVEVHNDVRTPFEFWNQILPTFRQKLSTGDFIVFYFSGHGFSHGADSFIAPTELPLSMTVQNVTDFAVAVESIKATLETHSPGLILFIIDACRATGALKVSDIKPNENENLISKGPAIMQNDNSTVNTIIAYATQPGHIALGTSMPGQASPFTSALIPHLLTEGSPFSAVFKDAAAELATSTQPAQIPGTFDWSRTDPYLKPNARVLADEEEAWHSALTSSGWRNISVFVQRYSVSRYSFAGQKWLAEHRQDQLASAFVAASPIAIERAWRSTPGTASAIRQMSVPIAFAPTLILDEKQRLRITGDEELGIVPSGIGRNKLAQLRTGEKFLSTILPRALPQKEFYRNSLAYSLANINAHRSVVLTRSVNAYDEPKVTSTVVAQVPAHVVLQVSDVIVEPDTTVWLEATGTGNKKPFYIQLEAGPAPEILELGRSLKEVYVPRRPNSLPELVDASVLKLAVADLKAQGWKISWISLATGATNDEVEEASREARLANAEYVLKHLDVPLARSKDNNPDIGSRITSVAGRTDVRGGEVRIRFFGNK